jgi:curved DNA-binding protein CbpA
MRVGRSELQQDLYAVLGVQPCAARETIRRAHLRLALEFHPDRMRVSAPLAEERMKAINAAAAVLLDASARSLYDRLRFEASPEQGRDTAPSSAPPPAPRASPSQAAPASDWACSSEDWWRSQGARHVHNSRRDRAALWVIWIVGLAVGLVIRLAALPGGGPGSRHRYQPPRIPSWMVERPAWSPPLAPAVTPPTYASWGDLRELERQQRRLSRAMRRLNKLKRDWRASGLDAALEQARWHAPVGVLLARDGAVRPSAPATRIPSVAQDAPNPAPAARPGTWTVLEDGVWTERDARPAMRGHSP